MLAVLAVLVGINSGGVSVHATQTVELRLGQQLAAASAVAAAVVLLLSCCCRSFCCPSCFCIKGAFFCTQGALKVRSNSMKCRSGLFPAAAFSFDLQLAAGREITGAER